MDTKRLTISKEAISLIESLAYKVHEVELQFKRIQLEEGEREQVAGVLNDLKSQIGRFFMRHVDRRTRIREGAEIEKNYKHYWGLEKSRVDKMPKSHLGVSNCRFCGSSGIKERSNNATGEVFWYCPTCRQESRLEKGKQDTEHRSQ